MCCIIFSKKLVVIKNLEMEEREWEDEDSVDVSEMTNPIIKFKTISSLIWEENKIVNVHYSSNIFLNLRKVGRNPTRIFYREGGGVRVHYLYIGGEGAKHLEKVYR